MLHSTYDGRLIYKTSYEGSKAILRYDSLAKLQIVRERVLKERYTKENWFLFFYHTMYLRQLCELAGIETRLVHVLHFRDGGRHFRTARLFQQSCNTPGAVTSR